MNKTLGLLAAAATLLGVSGASSSATLDFLDDFTTVGDIWTVTGTKYNENADFKPDEYTPGMLGQFNSGTATLSLESPGSGEASLEFDLLGFRTVDGGNCCTDTFRLFVNGTQIFRGYFDMGGGGTNQIALQPPGTVVTAGSGLRHISLGIALVSGTNAIVFDYGEMQSIQDEGWGLDNVSIQASGLTPAVPEPQTYAMLAAGLGLLGAAARRLKPVA